MEGNFIDEIIRVKAALDTEFKIKDFGRLESFLDHTIRLILIYVKGNTAWIC